MTRETRTQLYIGAVAIGAAVSAAVAGWLWPIPHYTPAAWTLVAILALVVLAGAFPIKLSRQADASLLVVPLFMAVLLLHPTEAILIAAAGSIISELYLKAPKRAIAFNSGVNSLAAGAAGIVFVTLKPDTASYAHKWCMERMKEVAYPAG